MATSVRQKHPTFSLDVLYFVVCVRACRTPISAESKRAPLLGTDCQLMTCGREARWEGAVPIQSNNRKQNITKYTHTRTVYLTTFPFLPPPTPERPALTVGHLAATF